MYTYTIWLLTAVRNDCARLATIYLPCTGKRCDFFCLAAGICAVAKAGALTQWCTSGKLRSLLPEQSVQNLKPWWAPMMRC